jgi:hypothetical protein|nr:MAG TPA: hypothetical protein [Caudoviricetes sp.]
MKCPHFGVKLQETKENYTYDNDGKVESFEQHVIKTGAMAECIKDECAAWDCLKGCRFNERR